MAAWSTAMARGAGNVWYLSAGKDNPEAIVMPLLAIFWRCTRAYATFLTDDNAYAILQ
jgi:hypothetical protein